MRSRSTPALLAVALALIGAAGCVGPARTDDTYRGKAAATVERVRSSVEVVIVVGGAVDEHGVQAAYTSVAVAEADEDASAVTAAFSSVQPPSRRADAVRALALDAIDDATDLLDRARILVRRGDGAALVALLPELERASTDLQHLSAKLEEA